MYWRKAKPCSPQPNNRRACGVRLSSERCRNAVSSRNQLSVIRRQRNPRPLGRGGCQIRRVRSVLSAPVSATEANHWRISLQVQLDQKLLKDAPYAIDLLNKHAASWDETDAGERYWRLHPLTSLKDAAILFKFRFLPLSTWSFIATSGPCFEHEARELLMPSKSRAA